MAENRSFNQGYIVVQIVPILKVPYGAGPLIMGGLLMSPEYSTDGLKEVVEQLF